MKHLRFMIYDLRLVFACGRPSRISPHQQSSIINHKLAAGKISFVVFE